MRIEEARAANRFAPNARGRPQGFLWTQRKGSR